MKNELLPCPRCGVPPHLGYCCGEYMISGDDPSCPYCGNAFTEMHSSEYMEIQAWNRRAQKGTWKHITVFDRSYPRNKQAEGIAIQAAVAEGHCDKCSFLSRCSTDESFQPPVFAWCSRRKADILKSWEGVQNGN